MRILGMMRADASTEVGAPPSKELMERMGAFIEEVTKAGVLIASDGLLPSANGKRIKLADGKLTIIDGPFTESKELVASYALFDVKSMDEALHWTQRFLEVLGKGECELRPIFEWREANGEWRMVDPESFPTEVFTPEERAREETSRERMRRNAAKA